MVVFLPFSFHVDATKNEILGDIMDFMMSKVTELINKYASWVNVPHVPLDRFNYYMGVISNFLGQANSIFPVDDLLLMLAILIALTVVFFIIWGISFIRKLLPF